MHSTDGRRRPLAPHAALPGLLSALLLILSASLPARARAEGDAFRLLGAVAGEVRFEFRGDEAGFTRAGDGTLTVLDRGHSSEPRGPAASLPGASAWVALPPGAAARVSMQVLEEHPLPWPPGTTPQEKAALLALLDPEGWAASGESWVRNQWGKGVHFCPVAPDGRGGLRYISQAVFQVAFPPQGSLPCRPASGRDPFESLYRGQFLNYEQGRAWRRAQEPPRKTGTPEERGDYFSSTDSPWIKLFVSRRGLYEVRGDDLQGLGVSLGSVDPQTMRMFTGSPLPLSEDLGVDESPSWMHEVPIQVVGGEDGSFDAQDAVRFVGLGPDGWRDDLGIPDTPYDLYYRDYYNNENVYWLTWGGSFSGSPQRMESTDGTAIFEPYVNVVQDRIHLEQSQVWDPRPREEGPEGTVPVWQRYWWLILSLNSSDIEQTLRVQIPDPVVDLPVTVRARFWGDSYIPTDVHNPIPWPDHLLRLRLNDSVIAVTDRQADGEGWDNYQHADVDTTGLWLAPGEQKFGFLLPVHPLPPYADRVRDFDLIALAWIEMGYSRRLVAHGDTLAFRVEGLSGAHTLEMTGFSREDITVVDASDPAHPRLVQAAVSPTEGAAGYTARFRTVLDPDAPARFLAATGASLIRPGPEAGDLRMTLRPHPADGYLRERTAPVQAIVITHSDFRAQAGELAQFRRGHLAGFPAAEVAVVDVEEIYDEFSFGRVDPTAVRNFLELARSRWNGGDPEQGPAFITLLGDTNYDFRNLLGKGAQIFVPTYEGLYDRTLLYGTFSPQFGSDDYFGYLDGPADRGLDLFIGRLPAETPQEAETMVEKITGYETSGALEPWRGRITLVADDICQATNEDILGFLHMKQTEALPARIPASIQQDKIYLYEYGTECAYDRKPAATAALLDRMNEGTLVVNFTGHGSEQQLADERVFETSNVPSLTNRDRLFMFITASCSVGKYDFFGRSLGESMLLHPSGGAVSVFCASSIANSNGNANLNQEFFEAEFPGRSAEAARPIGEAIARAKAAILNPGDLNSKRYVLLGDPATRLAAPALAMELSLTDARKGNALGDTLGRGLRTTLSGRVLTSDGALAADFNGTAAVRVYDSALARIVLTPDTLRYDLLGAPIYRGEAPVVNGVLTTTFQVPSALRTGLRGFAGIYVYAQDGTTDAGGSLDSLVVPEREAPPSLDQEGPAITLRFEGDVQALRPQAWFEASLKDSSGINITGLVGSRSVVMQIEEEGGALVAAQDLAPLVTFGASYDSAYVRSNLPASLQSDHPYVFVLRASDNLKNSASVRIPFVIGTGAVTGFELSGVYSFPNPTEGPARFYGRITEDADIDVSLYTLSGRRIWSLDRPVRMTPVSFAQAGIAWGGRDADGDPLANGVYLYKVSARSAGEGRSLTAVEKLVVYRRR